MAGLVSAPDMKFRPVSSGPSELKNLPMLVIEPPNDTLTAPLFRSSSAHGVVRPTAEPQVQI